MIESFGASDPGCVRANNEDYFLVVPSLGLYVVADGMGGAQAGEHASRLAADTVREVMEVTPKPRDRDALESAFYEANLRVSAAAESNPEMEGMGTTLVAALENGNDLIVASVGDSRLYTYHNGDFKTVTDDQTWVNEVGRRLGLDEETLKNHPMRHVLTMAIGVSDQLRVHTYTIPNTPGMQILMCSDGLHGVASEPEMVRVLSTEDSLRDKCRQLIEAARNSGGPDNITALLLKMS
ncbi:MAG: PP2C family serine/threonine-protein phosphatase [Bryobacteraceae bacterium]